jgi:two-component system, LuxR family, sensor kinase FixL
LAVSRAIVDLHGGRLWGEVANHGVFKIELPVADADTVPPGPV